MSIESKFADLETYQNLCTIKVVGVGGGGNNAVDHMIEAGIAGVEFWVANTDVQMLSKSRANNRIILGETITKGLGAGANPSVGREAALESEDKIREALEGADMVFIAAGMGGGTGTGAAPVFAKIAKELGALTIGVVTRPFGFEGKGRSSQASEGIESLKENVDSLIIISNDRLLQMNGSIPFDKSFELADDILGQSVRTITDLISTTGLINRDFADVRTVMYNKGIAMIGFGSATGANRVSEATNKAISSPLLEASFQGARQAIVNIAGGNVTLYDINDVTEIIREASGNDINIIFGASIIKELGDEIRVSVIATDFDETCVVRNEIAYKRPTTVEYQQTVLDIDETIKDVRNETVSEEKDSYREDLIPDFLK